MRIARTALRRLIREMISDLETSPLYAVGDPVRIVSTGAEGVVDNVVWKSQHEKFFYRIKIYPEFIGVSGSMWGSAFEDNVEPLDPMMLN